MYENIKFDTQSITVQWAAGLSYRGGHRQHVSAATTAVLSDRTPHHVCRWHNRGEKNYSNEVNSLAMWYTLQKARIRAPHRAPPFNKFTWLGLLTHISELQVILCTQSMSQVQPTGEWLHPPNWTFPLPALLFSNHLHFLCYCGTLQPSLICNPSIWK